MKIFTKFGRAASRRRIGNLNCEWCVAARPRPCRHTPKRRRKKTRATDLENVNTLRGDTVANSIVQVWVQPAAAALVHFVRQPRENSRAQTACAVQVAAYSDGHIRHEGRAIVSIRHVEPAQGTAKKLGAARDLVEAERLCRKTRCGFPRALSRV